MDNGRSKKKSPADNGRSDKKSPANNDTGRRWDEAISSVEDMANGTEFRDFTPVHDVTSPTPPEPVDGTPKRKTPRKSNGNGIPVVNSPSPRRSPRKLTTPFAVTTKGVAENMTEQGKISLSNVFFSGILLSENFGIGPSLCGVRGIFV